MEKESS